MRPGMLGTGTGRTCTVSCMVQDFHRGLNVDKPRAPPANMLYEMPRPTSFGKDSGLQFRMAMTMFLLGAVYVALVVIMLAAFFATIAAYIVQFGFFFGGSSSDDDDGPGFIVLLLASMAVYVVSFFLMQALSRYREFAADRGAALITGRPSALASALVKISSGMHRIPQRDLRATSELQAFYILTTGSGRKVVKLIATITTL